MIKRRNNDLQNTTPSKKDWATRTSLKPGGKLLCSGRVISSYSTNDTRRITVKSSPFEEISGNCEQDGTHCWLHWSLTTGSCGKDVPRVFLSHLSSSRKSKDRQYNAQNKSTRGKTTIYKTLHIKLKIEQHKPH